MPVLDLFVDSAAAAAAAPAAPVALLAAEGLDESP